MYSTKYKNLTAVPDEAKIAIPNDPTNGSRALLLLQKSHLIKLKAVEYPTVLDIIDNPKKSKIIEIDAPQVARSLSDVDYGVVNTDWILQAKIDPKTALIMEDAVGNPYTNIIALRAETKDSEDIAKLVLITIVLKSNTLLKQNLMELFYQLGKKNHKTCLARAYNLFGILLSLPY